MCLQWVYRLTQQTQFEVGAEAGGGSAVSGLLGAGAEARIAGADQWNTDGFAAR